MSCEDHHRQRLHYVGAQIIVDGTAQLSPGGLVILTMVCPVPVPVCLDLCSIEDEISTDRIEFELQYRKLNLNF